MSKAERQTTVDALTQRLGGSPNIYVTDFSGLDVRKITELRRRLRQAGFRRLRFARVVHGWGDLPGVVDGFAGEPPTWDWLVRAEA